ncbi:MAG: type II secretion system minor pseudopilin GspH [Gammaproteobacteria bacterium]|nr:type II secretion system minor pseudopilin GspH [Gammaproteobacteria bacterium]
MYHSFTKARCATGFTLFELLVTLVIISIIVTMTVLSIGDNQAERERRLTEQLATLMELAQESALFNAEEFALHFWRHGYSFYRLDGEQWQLIMNDAQLRTRELPEDIVITLYLEGLKVKLPELFLPESETKTQPQIFILSSGETTPFEIRLGNGQDTDMELISNILGNLTMKRRDG